MIIFFNYKPLFVYFFPALFNGVMKHTWRDGSVWDLCSRGPGFHSRPVTYGFMKQKVKWRMSCTGGSEPTLSCRSLVTPFNGSGTGMRIKTTPILIYLYRIPQLARRTVPRNGGLPPLKAIRYLLFTFQNGAFVYWAMCFW